MIIQKKDYWQTISIEDLIEFVIGGDWGKDETHKDEDFDLAYCIRGSEFKRWTEERGQTASIRKIKKRSIETRKLQYGDILLEISGGGPDQPVGRTVLIENQTLQRLSKYPIVCTNFLRLLRITDLLDKKFVNQYLEFFYKSGEIVKYQGGSNNLRNLKFDDYKQIEIPIAPLLEQKAIVAKIEQLFSELDNGIENLKIAQAKLKIYRQAVLQKAFEGEFTREWREKQTHLPTAEELLETIKQERQAYYLQQLEEWKQAVKESEISGCNGKKPSKPQQYSEKLYDFDYIRFDIPLYWKWISFGKVFVKSPQNGIYKPATAYGSGTYIIRIDDFYDGNLVKTKNFKRLSLTNDEITLYKVEENSILVNRVNSMDYLGKCALIKNLVEDTVFESNIMKVNTLLVNNKYLTLFLSSLSGKQNLQINAKQAVNQASINQTDVSSTLIPLCSVQEQNQIVQEIESRLSVCDKIEETIKQILLKSEALRQSILKKAFEGNLLNAQELEAIHAHPDYESAEKLLKRIKQERAK